MLFPGMFELNVQVCRLRAEIDAYREALTCIKAAEAQQFLKQEAWLELSRLQAKIATDALEQKTSSPGESK